MGKKANKFHGNQIPKSVDVFSDSNTAWRKVVKAGNYKNWMDYQKWVLAQVKPINRYKKGI